MMLAFEVADDAPVTPGEVVKHLEAAGIETRPIVAGNLVRHPAMDHIPHRAAESLAVADRILERGFMIGCHPMAEPQELEHVESALSSLEKL